MPQVGKEGGRYEVGEELAAGGMGTVYKGFDRLAQRTVAYKRLRLPSEERRSRLTALFQREYDTLTRLVHPNIVEVYDFGFDLHGPYYTMELLSGSDLRHLAPLPFLETCRMMRDVASALALLHARRLVHRDVGPNNVRVTEDRHAKLIDFGTLMHFGPPAEIAGTPAFMAPECVTPGESLDARTDLYALGALTYWTLTGHTHNSARSLEELYAALSERVVPPSEIVPGLPQALDELVLQLLQYDRVARPATAADVIARLTAIADLPPEADAERVAYSYLRYPPLIGRELPLADFEKALRSALAGEGQILLPQGERGLGHSALLDRFATDAQLAGATVLRAKGEPGAGVFAVARELVDRGFAIFPDVASRLRDRGSMFAQLAGVTKGPRSATDASESQARLTAALSDSLLQLSLRSPLVLLIDDAQSADAESLALFASLVDALPEHPILLVLGALEDSTDRNAEARAKLQGHGRRTTLSPLDEGALRQLVATMFGNAPNGNLVASWLHAHTGGNPAQAMDLARDLLARGAIRYTGGTFSLPHELDAAISDERRSETLLAGLTGVSTNAHELAVVIALHPGLLSAELLVRVTRHTPRDVLLAVEELVRRGVVVAHGEGYSCASESLRSALRGSALAERVHALHVALAQALGADDDGSLERRLAIAGHLLRAGGEEAREGAYLLANTGDDYHFELAMMKSALPLLERALSVLQVHGLPDEECIGVLVPLSVAGFYGSMEVQRRYLDRTLHALSSICGLLLARRLRRWVGPRLSLYLGLTFAFWVQMFTRRRLNRRSFVANLEALLSIMGPATAAAASVFDAPECFRIGAWLDPLAAAPELKGLYLIREFCIATAEIAAGKVKRADARYAAIRRAFEKPVPGVDDVLRLQATLGCLHGEAQARVSETDPSALPLADELVKRGPFYAPHVECIRMSYHAYRGESAQAAVHRARSEMFAFQGGTAWSAMTILTARSSHGCVLTGDVVGLVRVVADLARLSKLSPIIEELHQLAEAHLMQLRGHPESALPIYERVLNPEKALELSYYAFDRSMHAQCLIALGEFARAKAMCLEVLTHDRYELEIAKRMPTQKLALAEAGLGNLTEAAALLDACLKGPALHDNPLTLGSIHRDRAYVAALAGDLPSFETHYVAMEHYFRSTENPWLIQQSAALRAQAVRLGLALPGTRAARREHPPDELDGSTEIASAYRAADEEASPADTARVAQSHTRSVVPQGPTARSGASFPDERVVDIREHAERQRAKKR